MIDIKFYSKEFETAHVQFAKKYWTKTRRFTPRYIYWKFRGFPDRELKSFILAFDGSKIVGQFGLIPCQVLIDGTVVEGQWACDLMVDPDYRGKGVAEKLYDFAHQNKPITLGSDPSPAAEKSMIKKGYISLDGPRKFIFPIKVGEIFKLKGINNRFLNVIPNPFLSILLLFKSNVYKKVNTDDYRLLNHSSSSEFINCQYDKEFYNWRFSSFQPFYTGIDCYEKDPDNFFSGYYSSGIYLLTDFKVSSLRSFLSIIAFIYFMYSKLGLKRVKFVSMDSKLNRKLPFLGFILFGTRTKVILFSRITSIKKFIKQKNFYYTLHDSDENI